MQSLLLVLKTEKHRLLFLLIKIGTILINYQDGTTDEVPLKLGYTAWWYSCANGTEPHKIPKDFKGPKINFSGSVFADVITRIYYASTHDMDAKVDDNGVFHTSTKNAAQFGMYTGFGPWFLGHGSYYNDAWSRDADRVLMEFCEFGYETQMWASCDWFNKKLMWYPAQFPGTNINEKPLPGHWVQNANKPAAPRVVPMPTGFGDLQNDGHGLMMMAQYKGWLADGKIKKYLKNSWTNFNEAAEYICWLFDNPSISHAKNNRLYSDTEGEISLENKLESLAVRLGPYPQETKEVKVSINGGKEFSEKTFSRGDSRWIWIKDLNTEKKYKITVGSSQC